MRGSNSHRGFNPEQREACFKLRREGFTSKAAAEHLRTIGYGRLEPFEISRASVIRIARELAETREPSMGIDLAATEPTRAVDVLAAEAIRLAQLRQDRLRRLSDRGKLTDEKLREHLRMLREAKALAAKVPRSTPSQAPANGKPKGANDQTAWLEDDAEPKRQPTVDKSGTDPSTPEPSEADKGQRITESTAV